MELNSNAIKISGKFEIPLNEELEKDHDYLVALEGSITGVNNDSNQDGTENRTWKFKPLAGQIEGKKGHSIPLKSKAGKSLQMRMMIVREFGMNYDEAMDAILSDPEALRVFIEERQWV